MFHCTGPRRVRSGSGWPRRRTRSRCRCRLRGAESRRARSASSCSRPYRRGRGNAAPPGPAHRLPATPPVRASPAAGDAVDGPSWPMAGAAVGVPFSADATRPPPAVHMPRREACPRPCFSRMDGSTERLPERQTPRASWCLRPRQRDRASSGDGRVSFTRPDGHVAGAGAIVGGPEGARAASDRARRRAQRRRLQELVRAVLRAHDRAECRARRGASARRAR